MGKMGMGFKFQMGMGIVIEMGGNWDKKSVPHNHISNANMAYQRNGHHLCTNQAQCRVISLMGIVLTQTDN